MPMHKLQECCALCGRKLGPSTWGVRSGTATVWPASLFTRLCLVCLDVHLRMQGELPDNPIVNFTAHTLLCGAATAQVLQKTWPELLDQADAVVVNLGEMSIAGLPVGFLGGS